jgi:hypothetical protein
MTPVKKKSIRKLKRLPLVVSDGQSFGRPNYTQTDFVGPRAPQARNRGL